MGSLMRRLHVTSRLESRRARTFWMWTLKQGGLFRMSIASKYAGKCKTCGVSWNAGEQILKKVDWKDWCCNANCTQASNLPQQTQQQQQQTQQQTKIQTEASTAKYATLHTEIWNFALSEATKVYPDEAGRTARMILAQVFYKKSFDCVIHSGDRGNKERKDRETDS